MLKIGILLGDDIGLEVVPEAVKVMKAAAEKTGLGIDWHPLPIGRKAHESHGHTLPPGTVETLERMDGWVQGPIGHSAYPRNDPTWLNPPLRKMFDLYASVKPVKSYANLPSLHQNVDIVFVRETTEGMARGGTVVAGSGEFRPNDEISIGMRVITRRGSNRVARAAFEIARPRSRKKVAAVHKAPTYTLCCGMFAEECRKVAGEFPEVKLEEVLIDGFAMKLNMNPQQFDVVVTTNQFGDILTDQGAGLVGGLGLAPGLCAGERQAMAQATHGSAPDIAGKGIANPYAMIMSGKMLLEWLGRKRGEPKAVEAAALIDSAVDQVIAGAKALTPFSGAPRSTTPTTRPSPCSTASRLGIDVKKLKTVVFQANAEALTALMGGHVDLSPMSAAAALRTAQQGKLRVIGIASERRGEGAMAEIPTWKEQGFDVVFTNIRFMLGPRGMSPAQTAYWDGAFKRLVESAEWKKELERNHWEPEYVDSRQAPARLAALYQQLKGALVDVGLAKN